VLPGPPLVCQHPEAVTGMDFAILDGDKITVLYAFLDAA
jgi:hypothetical protein